MNTVSEKFQLVLNEISRIDYKIYSVTGKNLDFGHKIGHLVLGKINYDNNFIATDTDEDIEYQYSIRTYGERSVFMICERRYEFEYSNITRIYNLFHCINNYGFTLPYNTQHINCSSDYARRSIWQHNGSYCHYDTAGSPIGNNVYHQTYVYNYSAYDKSERVIAGPKNSQFHAYPDGEYLDGITALTFRDYPDL